jgi:hypothetical protein
MCFIRLLAHSAEGGYVWDERDFYRRVSCSSKKTAHGVWNFCVFNEILLKTENGYTALAWLKEMNLLVDNNRR